MSEIILAQLEIPKRHDLTVGEANMIFHASAEPFDMMFLAFRLGFSRGQQTTAEREKNAG